MVLSIAHGDDIETSFAQIQIFFARSNTNLVCWVVETMGSVHYISLPESQKVIDGCNPFTSFQDVVLYSFHLP